MSLRLLGAFSLSSVACGLLLSLSSSEARAQTYYIDEDTNYQNGNACDIYDVNTITSSLETQLKSDSWTGLRYTEYAAWPQDYWEESSSAYGTGGADGTFGDNYVLTVMAGHGNAHLLAYSNTGNGGTYDGSLQCTVDLSENAALGELDGAHAAFGMWLECQVIQISELPNIWPIHRLRQIAGWRNSISIGDDEPKDFYQGTAAATNVNAWGNQMSSGGRQAIVATFSEEGATDCWNVHDRAQLKNQTFLYPLSANPVYYCYTTWN